MALESNARTPPRVQWATYNAYAGCKIDGTEEVPLPTTPRHMDRAYYLTAQLEAPKYGAVQSYDGAGMSGGPLHHIAVYPSDKSQGSLFALIGAMQQKGFPPDSLLNLLAAYRTIGWALAKDGKVRNAKTQAVIAGTDIIKEFTPPAGLVPRTGPLWEQAKRWAVLHHYVFADRALFHAQKEFAIDWLVSGCKSTEDLFYKGKNARDLEVERDLSPAEDLALSVYHAYSVNAPAVAREVLKNALSSSPKAQGIPANLIAGFARSTFGNWQNRYLRTRNVAVLSNLWPASLFTGKAAVFPLRNALVG